MGAVHVAAGSGKQVTKNKDLFGRLFKFFTPNYHVKHTTVRIRNACKILPMKRENFQENFDSSVIYFVCDNGYNVF